MPPKFQAGERVRINDKLFPSYDEGLFNALPKTGVVLKVEPDSILPYQVAIDTFAHHPFWFYENQLLFENAAKEEAWNREHAPKPRGGATVPTAPEGGA